MGAYKLCIALIAMHASILDVQTLTTRTNSSSVEDFAQISDENSTGISYAESGIFTTLNGTPSSKQTSDDSSLEVTLNDDGDVAEPLPATLTYEVFPSADDIITNSTRCSHTQLSFTKETLLHIWEIKGLIGYISYIKRFDQPFEVKTDHVSFKSENVDGKWTFKVLKVRHHSPFSVHTSSATPTTVSPSATSAGYAIPTTADVGDIRIVATYSYESKQPRNSDFIIRPSIIHGSKEVKLASQKSTSPTIIQQKYYNTRGYQLSSNFLEYSYTFTWTNVIKPLNEIKSGLFNSKLDHFDRARDGVNDNHTEDNEDGDDSNANAHNEEASEEFFEEITKTDFSGHFGDISLKFIIQAYFPEEPLSITSSRCNSSILDLVVGPNLYEKLTSPRRPSGLLNKDRPNRLHHGPSKHLGVPPYLRYANSMIYDDRFTDVILVVGEDEIPAHRIILATSSPVFSAILENTTLSVAATQPPSSASSSSSLEDQNQADCPSGSLQVHLPRIHIEPPDIGLDTVEELLRYIYTGSVDTIKMKVGHIASRLILLGDKYRLPELKRHCESILLQELTSDNAIEMYLLGTRVSSERMTRKALIVMKMNKVKLASQTEEFRELSMRHPTLMYELFLSD